MNIIDARREEIIPISDCLFEKWDTEIEAKHPDIDKTIMPNPKSFEIILFFFKMKKTIATKVKNKEPKKANFFTFLIFISFFSLITCSS